MQLTLLDATWGCPIRVDRILGKARVDRLVRFRCIGPFKEVFVGKITHKSKITIIFASVKIQI